ncbi:MAG: CoA ester lyase [Streptosporangiales bacterium]|nr:CoA ester lyase [Streptosporangiales bacterium]
MDDWLPPGPALLFCPADRPDRYAKAYDRADGVILDLEDGVAEGDKDKARAALVAARADLDPARTIVRINAAGTGHRQADLETLEALDVSAVMLPKAADPAEIGTLAPLPVIALCETAAGVLAAPELARAPGCAALTWGAEDLTADIGGSSSRGPDGAYREAMRHARSTVLLAAAAAGIAAIDAIWLAIKDLDGLAAEAEDGVAGGFVAKLLIHPGHVETVRAAFRPSAERVDWARRVLAAAESGPGAIQLDGQMVDAPLIAQARRVLALAAPEDRG